VVEASKHRSPDDPAVAGWASRQWAWETEASVWAINVVAVDVLGEETCTCRSLMTMAWSKHSVCIERTTRSPMSFARGARTGVGTLAMPSFARRAPKVLP